MKRVLAFILACMMLLTFTSCVLNEEKDRQTTVLTINGEDIKKEEFTKLVNYTALAYKASNDTDILSDAETAKSYKEYIFDQFEDTMTKVYAAKEEGLKINKKDVQKSADNDYKALRKALVGKKGSDKEFLATLKKYGFDSIKDFKAYSYTAAERSAYVEALSKNYTKNKLGDKDTTAFTIMTVDGTDVPAYIYYYYYFSKELTDYVSSGGKNEQKSEEQQKAHYEEIAKTLAADVKLVEAGKAKDYKFTDKELKKKASSISYPEMIYGEKEITKYFKGYGISEKQYKEARNYQARAALTKEKLESDIKKEVKENATDADAEKFYKSNKERYSTATVSAKHILVNGEREDLAKYIKKQADDSGFDTIYDLYEKSKDRTDAILEISDLGAFDHKTMVNEFSEAAFGADVGKVVGPVKTQYGYHIIYVYDKKDGEVKPFEDVKKNAKEDYIESETAKRIEKEVTSLTEKPKFKILDKEGIKMPYDKYIENFKEKLGVKAYKKKAIR